MKKLVLASFLLAGILGAKAQQKTVILKTATPQTSTTIAGGNSVIIGDGAGNQAGSAISPLTGANNVFVGFLSGMVNTTGESNTFLGWGTGPANVIGNYNTFVGRSAGAVNTAGHNNSFLGGNSGFSNTTGYFNSFLGVNSGFNNISGVYNVVIGVNAGHTNKVGNENTILGTQAGFSTTGSGNVFLGNASGYSETGSNKLYIANSSTTTPLIWGDFSTSQLRMNGKVNIGSNPFPTNALYSNYQLFVKGGILTDEVRVALSTATGWADYVFAKDYDLKPLAEVEAFIAKNKHLPNVPSAAQVKEEGIALGDMSRIQQEKIEELTLYIIAQNKRIEALEAKMNTTK